MRTSTLCLAAKQLGNREPLLQVEERVLKAGYVGESLRMLLDISVSDAESCVMCDVLSMPTSNETGNISLTLALACYIKILYGNVLQLVDATLLGGCQVF